MASVELRGVSKDFGGGGHAVRGVDLVIGDGEFVVLVGPSGCGKSTTLRMIAGLEYPSAGRVFIGERDVTDVSPRERDVAMVFQNYALYPHMTVRKNMSFALKLRGMARDEIERRVSRVAGMLGIGELLDRRPGQLSGGQRQRVAVGRAIVREPAVFLFDEPLSNLDAKLRVATRGELKVLHQQLRTTTVYVTHDQEEAMTLGDRIVVMRQGRILQDAAPIVAYERPANRFVASFIGTPPMNFVEGVLRDANGGVEFVGGEGGSEGVPRVLVGREAASRLDGWRGRRVVAGIRPTALREIGPDGEGVSSAGRGVIEGEIALVELLGEHSDVTVVPTGRTGASPMVARIATRPGLVSGARIRLGFEVERLHLFAPGDEGENLLYPAAGRATGDLVGAGGGR